MSIVFHLQHLPLAAAGQALLFSGIGALLGGAHFAGLRWNARRFLAGGMPWRALLLQLARMGITATALLACARIGALPLLAALAGLLLARRIALRKVGPT